MRTWQAELAVVAVSLGAVALLSGGGWLELVGAAAVALSFAHAQVADRLAEREQKRELAHTISGITGLEVGDGPLRVSAPGALPPGLLPDEEYIVAAIHPLRLKSIKIVECHRWAARYLVSKELLWLAYFVAHRSWSALAGVGIFLAYRPWRAWWRRRHPLTLVDVRRDRAAADDGDDPC